MVLIIDNYDSFTYNLYQQVAGLGFEVKVVTHDGVTVEEISALHPERVIISPGPKDPKDSGISCAVIESLHRAVPILGVCLGHQCIGAVFGSRVVPAKEIRHGKASPVFHGGTGIFQGLPGPFSAARYHSLALETVPTGFERTAWTEDGEIMGISHREYPLHGIQFHPESFLTAEGSRIMANFLK